MTFFPAQSFGTKTSKIFHMNVLIISNRIFNREGMCCRLYNSEKHARSFVVANLVVARCGQRSHARSTSSRTVVVRLGT